MTASGWIAPGGSTRQRSASIRGLRSHGPPGRWPRLRPTQDKAGRRKSSLVGRSGWRPQSLAVSGSVRRSEATAGMGRAGSASTPAGAVWHAVPDVVITAAGTPSARLSPEWRKKAAERSSGLPSAGSGGGPASSPGRPQASGCQTGCGTGTGAAVQAAAGLAAGSESLKVPASGSPGPAPVQDGVIMPLCGGVSSGFDPEHERPRPDLAPQRLLLPLAQGGQANTGPGLAFALGFLLAVTLAGWVIDPELDSSGSMLADPAAERSDSWWRSSAPSAEPPCR